jgi:hypothetical protein
MNKVTVGMCDSKKPLGRPVKVFYKGKWRKIYWNPCVLINGRVIDLADLK